MKMTRPEARSKAHTVQQTKEINVRDASRTQREYLMSP